MDDVEPDAIARVFKTLGIDIENQVQGSQVHYRGRTSVISVWMVAGVSLERFCKDVNIKVATGIMTGMIRPAGKKDVAVTVAGLDFNTPDNFVVDYLNKFGTVLSNVYIYSKYESGPFKGKYNGERKYQVDFSKSTRQMGTYHLIDGCKVRIFYRGNKKTCGRCQKTANDCPGNAISRNCAIGGGVRVFLSDHMKNLWQEIGFVPTSFELEESDKTEDDLEQAEKDAPKVSQEKFPPRLQRQEPSIRDMEHSNGITIRNLPGILDDKEILTFLMNYGLPHDHDIQHIHINKGGKNTWVMIDFLEPKDVQTIFHCVDFHATKTKFFDVPIFCKPLRNMTPVKKSKDESEAANDILTKRSAITDKKKVEEMNTASNDTNKPAV